MKYLYIIIAALMIAIVLLHLKKEKPLPNVLRQQTVTDSLKIISLNKRVLTLDSIISIEKEKVRKLRIGNANITDKYNKEREKLNKLSQDVAIQQFADKTGGRVDSVYSIPRMNLIKALEIFILADEQLAINNNMNKIVSLQDSTITNKDKQIETLKEVSSILSDNLELHKTALNLSLKENTKTNKKMKWQKIKTAVIGGIAFAELCYIFVR